MYIPTSFKKLVADSIKDNLSDYDYLLKLAELESQAKERGISLYERIAEVVYQYKIEQQAKEWLKNK